MSGDSDAAIVGLGECKDTIISVATSMSFEPSNKKFSSMHVVVDVYSNDSTSVIANEVSDIVIESYYTIDQQSVDVHFWDSTMFNMDATLSYDNLMFEIDVDHSLEWSWAKFSPSTKIQFCVAAVRKKRFHRSSMELPSGDILTFTSSAQVLGVSLQDRWLVLIIFICSWFNVHRDVTNYFNWGLGGGWSSLCFWIA